MAHDEHEIAKRRHDQLVQSIVKNHSTRLAFQKIEEFLKKVVSDERKRQKIFEATISETLKDNNITITFSESEITERFRNDLLKNAKILTSQEIQKQVSEVITRLQSATLDDGTSVMNEMEKFHKQRLRSDLARNIHLQQAIEITLFAPHESDIYASLSPESDPRILAEAIVRTSKVILGHTEEKDADSSSLTDTQRAQFKEQLINRLRETGTYETLVTLAKRMNLGSPEATLNHIMDEIVYHKDVECKQYLQEGIFTLLDDIKTQIIELAEKAQARLDRGDQSRGAPPPPP